MGELELEDSATSSGGFVLKSTVVDKVIEPRLDLGNLLIEDSAQLPFKRPTESELLSHTRDNVQYLFNKVWELDTKRVDEAICVTLPMPKPLTKWQQYANDKGIVKRQREKLAWDEQSQAWKPKYGYRRTNDNTKDWMIEVPDHKDAYADYFGERKQSKKERVSKNEFQRMKNLARRGDMNANHTPLGITSELGGKSTQELAHQIDRAKSSTASVGKFQSALPKEKPPKNRGKKRNFASNEGGVKSEKVHQLDILNRLQSKKPRIDTQRVSASYQQNGTADEPSEQSKRKSDGKKRSKERPRQKSAMHRQQHHLKSTRSKRTDLPQGGKKTAKKGTKGGKAAAGKKKAGK